MVFRAPLRNALILMVIALAGWAFSTVTYRDGNLIGPEHETGSRTLFTKMDQNHDSYLTPGEMQTGHERLLKK